MIQGIFHKGSGLGNQLHRYVASRVLSMDKGFGFSMVHPWDFKGKDFMNLDMGVKVEQTMNNYFPQFGETPPSNMTTFLEYKAVDEFGNSISSYDPEFNFIEDNTIIDGEFQDERYWEHREKEIDEWLKVEPIDIPDDVCVIGFRGGEYSLYPDLFLPMSYWDEAIRMMLKINPDMKFEVHTDDPSTAWGYFPDFKIIHEIGINWRSMRYAKYAIIANSSFYILPRWLRNGITIAPRYWARYNLKTWSMPSNWYSRFLYI